MVTIPSGIKVGVKRFLIGAKSERSSDLSSEVPVSISQGLVVKEEPIDSYRPNLAVILTAREVETLAVRQHLSGRKKRITKGRRVYDRYRFQLKNGSWDVVIKEIGEGIAHAAHITTHAIEDLNPKIIFFLGTAGGRKDKVKKGDVVFATAVHNGMAAKVSPSEFKETLEIGSRATSYESAEILVDLARICRTQVEEPNWKTRIKPRLPETGWKGRTEQIPDVDPSVHIEPMISTDILWTEVDSDWYKTISKRHENAVAWEMEGFGFLESAHDEPRTEAAVIRGIADFMQKKSKSDKQGWKEVAMLHASAFAFELIATFSDS